MTEAVRSNETSGTSPAASLESLNGYLFRHSSPDPTSAHYRLGVGHMLPDDGTRRLYSPLIAGYVAHIAEQRDGNLRPSWATTDEAQLGLAALYRLQARPGKDEVEAHAALVAQHQRAIDSLGHLTTSFTIFGVISEITAVLEDTGQYDALPAVQDVREAYALRAIQALGDSAGIEQAPAA